MAVATISVNFATANDILVGTDAATGINPAVLKQALQNGTLYQLNGTDAVFSGTVTANAFVGVFPAGTRLIFAQASAPTGWTQVTDASLNNAALRVVTSTGGGTGGTIDFTTAFTSQTLTGTVGHTTLSTSTMPSHSHSASVNGATINGGSVKMSPRCGRGCGENGADNQTLGVSVGATGGGGAHTHSFTGTSVNLNVKYVDVIVASKD